VRGPGAILRDALLGLAAVAGGIMSAAAAPPGLAGASERSPALKHAVLARCSTSSARVCSLELPHNTLELPIFMPVGTVRPRAATPPRARTLRTAWLAASAFARPGTPA
jgi:hypothetical protein